MKFITIFLTRPVFTSVLFITLTILGIVSFSRLPFDLLPDLTIPELTILTQYEGASPEIIEREITIKIEEGISGLGGIQDIRSISLEGISIVTIYFNRDTELKIATIRLREALDKISWGFPKEATRPNILRTGPTSSPVMGIWINGDKEIISKVILRRLEQIDGIGEARLCGTEGNEILLMIDPDILNSYNIDISDISRALLSYNIVMPLGIVKEGNYTFPIRFVYETETPEKIGNISLMGGKIKLKEIAKIIEKPKEKNLEIIYNGKKGYLIQIYKEWKKNTVVISKNVRDLLKRLKNIYPNVEYEICYDDAVFIKSAMLNIIFSIITGGLLAFFVLALFTGNINIPVVISLSMPISIISSFLLFYIFGVNINLISLSGIALAIGMLVDASIVVLENIIARKDVLIGTKEVGIAVITSVLTTIVVFFPIIYIHGISGMMLKPLSFAVISTLTISLFVSFSLLPLIVSKMGDIKKSESRIYQILNDKYSSFIEWAYKREKYVFIITFILFIFGLLSFILLKKEVFPDVYADRIINFELPYNSDIKETEKIVERLTKYLKNEGDLKILSEIGNYDPFGLSHTGSAKIRVSGLKEEISLKDFFNSYNSISYNISSVNPIISYFENKGKIYVRIPYTDFTDEQKKLSLAIRSFKDADFIFDKKIPVIDLCLNQSLSEHLNISPSDLFSFLQTSVSGNSIIDIEKGEEKWTIRMLVGDEKDLKSLLSIKYKGIPIGAFFEIKERFIPMGIVRFNGRRCIEGVIPYKGRYKFPSLPFNYEIGGELKEYKNSLKSAVFAFIISIFLVYMVLSSFYESLFLPLLIMITVPFSAAGGFFSLLITRTSINVISLLGIVILVGIVVNNAIVLLDYAEKKRKEGKIFPGKIASKRRLRPILMTTLTTVVGLLPISFGSTLQAPLGRCVIGGLLISTFISLIFIPIIYDKMVS
uniref:Efflux RND transporter permease subunit n=1 Tax=candidate division WOR-3 bacterium TaxID=2052148 RepID=A0A7C4YCR1_UNCW3